VVPSGWHPTRTQSSPRCRVKMEKLSCRICLNNPNLFVVSGGPGAGKTTVLHELASRGFPFAPEIARQIIQRKGAVRRSATLARSGGVHSPDAGAFRQILSVTHASLASYVFWPCHSCCRLTSRSMVIVPPSIKRGTFWTHQKAVVIWKRKATHRRFEG
jgi:hypothetical protein